MHESLPWIVTDARYAKGQKMVRPVSDGSGFKGRAHRLIDALNGRWSNRCHGYVMSARKVERLAELYLAGFDATVISRELVAPSAN
jgi:hypothetical protein